MPSSRRSSWRCRTRSTELLALALGLLLGAAFAMTGQAAAATDAGIAIGRLDDDPADARSAKKPAAASAGQGQARFEAALRLYTGGRRSDSPASGAAAAAAALQQLARELPTDEIAPEALFEAAQLYDEQLGRPDEAQRLYAELLRSYPSSRLCRRAESRLTQLREGLRTGAAALTRFQHIIRATAEGSIERIAELRALLGERPDFALADHALYLLGSAQLRSGHAAAAADSFAALESRFPSSEWTAYGHKAQADALIAGGQCAKARPHLHALARRSAPLWVTAAEEGLVRCEQIERQMLWARLAMAYLGLLALTLLVSARRAFWPPPYELFYYVPVAAFLVLISLQVKGGMFVAPVSLLAVLGVALNWLAAAAARRAASAKPRGRLRRILLLCVGVGWRVLAVAAICYLVAQTQDLLELLIETVRNGADD